ncbi:MAG TPA: HEAT repeat domain-containing protein [Pyrinomonadaceae bacterium]|nr:HEAT repeat domain-containing protein [Pyrinomonadaceae bacterium]
MRHLFLIVTLLGCWSTALGQKPGDSSELLKQLLALPAPLPRLTEASDNRARPNLTDKNSPPPDDAPIEDLQRYWDISNSLSERPQPSAIVRQRLIAASANTPAQLLHSLPFLNSTDAEQVKQVFDRIPNDDTNKYTHDEFRKWLLYNSKYFLDELLAKASKVKDDGKYGGVEREAELKTLAKLDWPTAEPLIKSLAETAQPRTATLAISLLYQHAIETADSSAEDKFRTRLQTVAANRDFPGWSRKAAIDALSETTWSGRDDWYLSLLEDESLTSLHDGVYGFSPLNTLFFFEDPDKWIPIMTKLVGSSNRKVQRSAGMCLVRYAIESPRRDAILPVLRWLSEPDWLPDDGMERTTFMQKMDELEMPESVPGLLWILENDEQNAKWAARTIGHYKDPRAIPALKRLLLHTDDSDDRMMILDGLVASGGLTEAEAIDGLEKLAEKSMTLVGQNEILDFYYSRSTVPLPISIGRYLATRNEVPTEIIRAVLARTTALRKQNPELARALLRIAERWQSRHVDLYILNRIAAGTAEAATIANVLERREKLHESLGQELQALIRVGGVAQAIGSILLDDNVLAQTILSSGDQQAQIALLACARLTQTPLPVAVVGSLLKSKNSLLAQAAERYLLIEDSKDAQTLLWQHHPGEGFITGWRENILFIGGNNFDAMGKQEEQLRKELFKENGPLEIFALFGNGSNYDRVLRIYSDRALYTHYEDAARYRERIVSRAELSAFKQFLDSTNLEEVGPQIGSCHYDCSVAEFVVLRKERGRRVFSHQGFGGLIKLIANFDLLGRGPDGKLRYRLESQIKGLEVLYADGETQVKDVWQHDDEIRVFTERTNEEIEKSEELNNTADDENDELTAREQKRREVALSQARFSWRKFSGGKLTETTTPPDVYPMFDYSKFSLQPEDELLLREQGVALKMLTADSIIIARNFDGLWKQVAGTRPVRISGEGGGYLHPVGTPDGQWVVTSKTDTNWGAPSYIVRFNLETGREFRVNLEPADDLRPIVFLPSLGKVLLRRAREDRLGGTQIGPEHAEYYLLAPGTGDTQTVSGEFAPLLQDGKRFLQATGKTDEFWAAIPDDAKDQTQVGRYNLKTFSFTPVLTIPHISFDSMSMWVDEKRAKIYIAYKGQLLSIPLQATGERR